MQQPENGVQDIDVEHRRSIVQHVMGELGFFHEMIFCHICAVHSWHPSLASSTLIGVTNIICVTSKKVLFHIGLTYILIAFAVMDSICWCDMDDYLHNTRYSEVNFYVGAHYREINRTRVTCTANIQCEDRATEHSVPFNIVCMCLVWLHVTCKIM